MKWLMFIGVATITIMITWYIGEGLLWLKFVLQPHTEFGMLTVSYWTHGVLLVLSLLFAWMVTIYE